MTKPVGLLTLQGDYDKHRQAFHALGVETFGVRRPGELERVSCLVIPGGESTTLTRLADRVGLREPIRNFAATHPVMGTCAGLIMLASHLEGEKKTDYGVEPFGLLDCTVVRNGYGRQIDSFTASLNMELMDGSIEPFPAVFIRAPRIMDVGPAAQILAEHGGEPVIIRQKNLLGMAFHPELTDDLRIHRAFLDMVTG
jgi:5'-phosphate synthase pdxT subunit